MIDALLLRPLPYADADRLVMVWQDMRAKGGPATEWTTPANHFDWKGETAIFEPGSNDLEMWKCGNVEIG